MLAVCPNQSLSALFELLLCLGKLRAQGRNVVGKVFSQDGDALVVEVMRIDGSVLKSYKYAPGAWRGKSTFASAQFSYQGDGSGVIRLRIGAAGNTIDDRFKGAIDNLIIKKTR